MPRARKHALFELGDQWIAQDPGSPYLHRFWTEPGTGRTRRASLGTKDLARAKKALAEIIVRGAPKSTTTLLSAVLLTYFEERTDKLPSAKHARLAGRTLLQCWGPMIRVEAITEAKQKEFAEWSIRKGHSLGYLSRNLSVLSAALTYSKLDKGIVFKEQTMIDRWTLNGPPRQRRLTPTDQELARVLLSCTSNNLWRWFIISLLTGARPQAVLDLTPSQRRRDTGTLDLNPLGRRQNKKHRATVREPRALSTWLDCWEAEMRATRSTRELIANPDIAHDRYCDYASIESVQSAIERIRQHPHVNLKRLSSYSCRHKVATVLRRAGVSRDQIEMQLGHARPDGYGEWDPAFLTGAAAALDTWWADMQAVTNTEHAARVAKLAANEPVPVARSLTAPIPVAHDGVQPTLAT